MSETKFTEGKWIKTGQFTVSIGGDESYLTTQQTGDYFSSVEEREANAHLISKAPDMYAMLENIAKYQFDSPSDSSKRDAIYKLLAEARGETHE